MSEKTNPPESDESARSRHPEAADDAMADVNAASADLQTSNKSGKHSSAEKLAASRPEFGTGRGAVAVDGAFGANTDEPHEITGRNAGPNTNQFRCNSCGRYLNTRGELSAHEPECRLAKEATSQGHRNLEQEDARPHQPNDAESKEHPFQHGTKQN